MSCSAFPIATATRRRERNSPAHSRPVGCFEHTCLSARTATRRTGTAVDGGEACRLWATRCFAGAGSTGRFPRSSKGARPERDTRHRVRRSRGRRRLSRGRARRRSSGRRIRGRAPGRADKSHRRRRSCRCGPISRRRIRGSIGWARRAAGSRRPRRAPRWPVIRDWPASGSAPRPR